MPRTSDLLRNQPTPSVFGYELDRVTLTPIKRAIDTRDGKFKAGDRVAYADINLRHRYAGTVESLTGGNMVTIRWDRDSQGMPFSAKEWAPNLIKVGES